MRKTLKEQKEKRGRRNFQRFLLWVIIPILILVFLGLLIAVTFGIEVGKEAKKIVAKVPSFSQMTMGEKQEDVEDYIEQLKEKLTKKESELNKLKGKLEQKEADIERLMLEQSQIDDAYEEKNKEEQQQLKEMVATFEAMTSKRAALILIEMKEDEAINILSHLNSDSLAQILEKMPPDQAARMSQLLTSEKRK